MIYYGDGLVERVSDIARFVGLNIMRDYVKDNRIGFFIKKKLDRSPVTNVDLFAHRSIVYFLRKLTPNIPILSEEHLPIWEECRDWDYFWLIDPLDGTKEFLSRNGEFTVNIAFIEYGIPVLGVVYVPYYNMLYAADNGKSWKITPMGEKLSIAVGMSCLQPVVVISRSNMCNKEEKKLQDYLVMKKIENCKIVNIGSSFKFCLVAEGKAQFYPRFSSTKIWDTAAGHAIATASGALVKDWNGHFLNYKNINKCFLNPGFQVS